MILNFIVRISLVFRSLVGCLTLGPFMALSGCSNLLGTTAIDSNFLFSQITDSSNSNSDSNSGSGSRWAQSVTPAGLMTSCGQVQVGDVGFPPGYINASAGATIVSTALMSPGYQSVMDGLLAGFGYYAVVVNDLGASITYQLSGADYIVNWTNGDRYAINFVGTDSGAQELSAFTLANTLSISIWSMPSASWIAVDDVGSIYGLDSSGLSGATAIGALPVGVDPVSFVGPTAFSRIRYDGLNYLLTTRTNASNDLQNSIYISNDLNTWTSWNQGLRGSNQNINNLYFDGTKWWLILSDVMGSGGTLYYRSPTAAAWTLASGSGRPAWTGLSMVTFNGLWLFGSDRSGWPGVTNLAYSSNGLSFNSQAIGMGTQYQMASLATNGSNLVVAAAPGYTADTLTSSSGINWSPAGFDFGSGVPGSVVFDGTYFYLGMSGSAPYLYRSTDGVSWVSLDSLASNGSSGILGDIPIGSLWYYSSQYMVYDSTAGAVESSSDGLNFSPLSHPQSASGRKFKRVYPNAVILNSD